ncbi:DUF4124 domain-containing protein [Geobacter sulfurreducens subsp. ethanolicus]|uniref:DUF4124 domain-containing protein n=1 Tax=Geobacter sulfurreducens TaxID=35554 RepID=UPI002574467B|nr:DUF4124 domain-containing protein [Geobacter sulfurreducens]BEH10589.1 DUF4124 domain-containing protein [Geobacter sulfurreducens subsp. ethanolicus]
MKSILVLLLVAVLAQPALGETYRWIDERGTVNFTEDPGKVPKKFRKKMTVISDPGSVAPEVVESVEEGSQPKAPAEGQGTPSRGTSEPQQNQVQQPEKEKKPVYGGKSEDVWKAEFGRLRNDIHLYENELADRKAKLANPAKMSRGEYLGTQTEVKRIEEKLAGLRGKLATLKENAAKAGVPLELRK